MNRSALLWWWYYGLPFHVFKILLMLQQYYIKKKCREGESLDLPLKMRKRFPSALGLGPPPSQCGSTRGESRPSIHSVPIYWDLTVCEAVFDLNYGEQWGSSWILHFNITLRLKASNKKEKKNQGQVQECMAGLRAGTWLDIYWRLVVRTSGWSVAKQH